MSSNKDEKQSKSFATATHKKKKHKHKNHGDDDIILQKNNKHKKNIQDLNAGKTLKSNKYNKLADSDSEVYSSKQSKNSKKKSKNDRSQTESTTSKNRMPMLSSSDVDSDNEDINYNVKNPAKINNEKPIKSNKIVQKIYSSSEDEDVKVVEDKSSPVPKKAESSDDYFDGWSKEDVVQLITRMGAAVPKNDTLKYVSRVEKLNWEQVAFGQHSPSECKEKWKVIEKKIRGYRILQEVLADAKVWLEHPWTDFYRGGKNKIRHPDMPKKPLTSYMIFYMKKKEKIIKENPGIILTNLSKIIAEKFNKLSPKKRAKYNKLANEMREKYQEDMQKFFHDHPSEVEKIVNAGKNKKGPITVMPGPAKPVPPLKLFLEDKIKQHKDEKDFNQVALIQQCKEKWKSMSSKKKMPWIRWAHEAEMRYLEELKFYQAENPSFEMPKFKSVLSKEEKKVMQRMEGKPEKPPGSAYGLFSKIMLKDPGLRAKFSTPKERMQEIAKLWKDVPKVEKDGYAEQVKHLLDNYKLEYASYLESLPEDKREEELASNVPKRKAKVEDAAVISAQKKLRLDKLAANAKEKERVMMETLLEKEPKAPSNSAYDLYEEEMKSMGVSSKKIKKGWEDSNMNTKQKYEMKLEALRQQYIIDYKNFLTSLKPKELKLYSEWKDKNQPKSVEIIDSPAASEISSEESEAEAEVEVPKSVSKKESSSSGSSSSSSSASSGSSSSSSDSSSSAEEQDDDVEFDSDAF